MAAVSRLRDVEWGEEKDRCTEGTQKVQRYLHYCKKQRSEKTHPQEVAYI